MNDVDVCASQPQLITRECNVVAPIIEENGRHVQLLSESTLRLQAVSVHNPLDRSASTAHESSTAEDIACPCDDGAQSDILDVFTMPENASSEILLPDTPTETSNAFERAITPQVSHPDVALRSSTSPVIPAPPNGLAPDLDIFDSENTPPKRARHRPSSLQDEAEADSTSLPAPIHHSPSTHAASSRLRPVAPSTETRPPRRLAIDMFPADDFRVSAPATPTPAKTRQPTSTMPLEQLHNSRFGSGDKSSPVFIAVSEVAQDGCGILTRVRLEKQNGLHSVLIFRLLRPLSTRLLCTEQAKVVAGVLLGMIGAGSA